MDDSNRQASDLTEAEITPAVIGAVLAALRQWSGVVETDGLTGSELEELAEQIARAALTADRQGSPQ